MSIITRNIDQVEVWDDWYECSLEFLAEGAKEKGIEIGTDRKGRPEISFSGFWSQGDGLAFDADINWPVFFEAFPKIKENHLRWFLLLSANPDYVNMGVRRNGRSNTAMCGNYFTQWPDVVEKGFFEGVETDTVVAELNLGELEEDVLDACQDVAYDMYKSLEKEYEDYCEQEVEYTKEQLLDKHVDELRKVIAWLMMQGEINTRVLDIEDVSEEVDFEDLLTLGLLQRSGTMYGYGVSALTDKAKELMR